MNSSSSSDPYLLVKSEVESSLQAAAAQLRTYKSLQTSAEEREWSRDELKGTLSALESDLQELEESVHVVQQDPARFGVTLAEVGHRKQFIDRVKGAWPVLVSLSLQTAEFRFCSRRNPGW